MLTDDGDTCAFPFPDFLHGAQKSFGLWGLVGENAPLEVTEEAKNQDGRQFIGHADVRLQLLEEHL